MTRLFTFIKNNKGQQTNGTLSHLLLDITVPIVAASTNTIVTQDLVSFQQPCFVSVKSCFLFNDIDEL